MALVDSNFRDDVHCVAVDEPGQAMFGGRSQVGVISSTIEVVAAARLVNYGDE